MKSIHCALLVVVSVSSWSQTSGDIKTFTIEECLSIASERNFEIRSSMGLYQSQSAALTQSFGSFLPQVSASMGYARQLNVEGGRTVNFNGQVITVPGVQPNSYSMGAFASYNIFNGFARESNFSRTQAELDAADYSLRRVRQTVSYTIRSQYLAVLRSMQITKIRRENLELGKRELERMRALFDAGRVPVASVYSQEADLGNREIEVVNADNAESQSKAQILSSLALAPDMKAEFLESSFVPTVDDNTLIEFRKEIGSYASAVTVALSIRADYLAATRQTDAAHSGLNAARGGYLPHVSASGGWTWSNTSFDNFSNNGRYYIQTSLSLPIFDNFATSTQVQQANIQIQQREIDRAQAEQRVRAEVQSAFLDLDAAEKQLEISRRVVVSATQNFEAMKERLNLGAASTLEYQSANNQLVSAKINRVNAVYTYFDAQFKVRLAVGSISDK